MEKFIIKESELKGMINDAVERALNEAYSYDDEINNGKNQAKVKNVAIEALKRAGFSEFFGDYSNDFVINVNVENTKQKSMIEKLLRRTLGVDDYFDLRIKYESRMFGENPYVTIYLPSYNRCANLK